MFKVGDKVVCIDNSGSGMRLNLNNTYIISRVEDDGYIMLVEVGVWYISSRFKLDQKYYRENKLKRILDV